MQEELKTYLEELLPVLKELFISLGMGEEDAQSTVRDVVVLITDQYAKKIYGSLPDEVLDELEQKLGSVSEEEKNTLTEEYATKAYSLEEAQVIYRSVTEEVVVNYLDILSQKMNEQQQQRIVEYKERLEKNFV